MSKPDEIPEDVWERSEEPAQEAFDASVDLYETGMESSSIQLIIARAILSERTKAAEIAATFPWSRAIENFDDARDLISSAIRKGGKE